MIAIKSSLAAAAVLTLLGAFPATAQNYDLSGDVYGDVGPRSPEPAYRPVEGGYAAIDRGYRPAYRRYEPSREAVVGPDGFTRTRCRPHKACSN